MSENIVQDAEENRENTEKKSFVAMWMDLPTALQRHVAQRFLMAFILAFVGVLLCIELHRKDPVLLVVFAVYIIWSALSLMIDWYDHKISELLLTCVSAESMGRGSRTKVTMISDEVPPEYHFYYLPGGKKDVMPINIPCLVYVRDTEPDLILTWFSL